MEKKEQLYEGKAKKVYTTGDPEKLIVAYKDDATAFNGLKKGTISGKGAINNRMSNFLMGMLEKHGVPGGLPPLPPAHPGHGPPQRQWSASPGWPQPPAKLRKWY